MASLLMRLSTGMERNASGDPSIRTKIMMVSDLNISISRFLGLRNGNNSQLPRLSRSVLKNARKRSMKTIFQNNSASLPAYLGSIGVIHRLAVIVISRNPNPNLKK